MKKYLLIALCAALAGCNEKDVMSEAESLKDAAVTSVEDMKRTVMGEKALHEKVGDAAVDMTDDMASAVDDMLNPCISSDGGECNMLEQAAHDIKKKFD